MTATTTTDPTCALTVDTLGDLGGEDARLTINAALAAAVRDAEDRGEDKKERTVTITVGLKKIEGDVVACSVKAKTTVPPYQTRPTIGQFRANGKKMELRFNPLSPKQPDQQVLPGAGK